MTDRTRHLTSDERAMQAGEAGEATRLAMRILTRIAPWYGAASLMAVTRAHVDGCIYQGEAGVEFAERLAQAGGRVRVPTSLNVVSLDRERWRGQGTTSAYASRADRLPRAYLTMGCSPTFTCAPYQTDAAPCFGEQIAWAESNAVAYANAIIGARTNRYGDYLDISCALTGRVPAAGLHLDGNRLGQVVVQLTDLPPRLMERDDFYPILGYLLGTLSGELVPIISGLDAHPTDDHLKSLAAAAATSGSVAHFHIVGITPEAATMTDALGGRPPLATIPVGLDDLRATRMALGQESGIDLDTVAFGSPHCSLAECSTIARLVDGQRAAPSVQVFVTTSHAVRTLLERNGQLAILEAFGATVTADTCIVVSPLVRPGSRVLMTNSAKYAHYAPGIIGAQAVFGSTEDCIASAIAGQVIIENGPWAP